MTCEFNGYKIRYIKDYPHYYFCVKDIENILSLDPDFSSRFVKRIVKNQDKYRKKDNLFYYITNSLFYIFPSAKRHKLFRYLADFSRHQFKP